MIDMQEVKDAINDLQIIGGEIAWLMEDMEEVSERRTWTVAQRTRLIAAATAADKIMGRIKAIRRSLGLAERPE